MEIVLSGVHCEIRGTYDFEPNTEYVVVISQSESGFARMDVGPVDGEMTKIGETQCTMIFNVTAAYSRGLSNIKFGYTKLPTEGNLQGGYINNFMMWNRGLNLNKAVGIARRVRVGQFQLPYVLSAA